MAREPDEKKKKAEAMYKSGATLIEIAAALDIPEGTIRSWKSRYHWGGSTAAENAAKNATKNATEKCNAAAKEQKKKEAIAEDVRQVMQNAELTDKQRLFCIMFDASTRQDHIRKRMGAAMRPPAARASGY